jgi:hypothetical protein
MKRDTRRRGELAQKREREMGARKWKSHEVDGKEEFAIHIRQSARTE